MYCYICDKTISQDEVYTLLKCKECGHYYELKDKQECPLCHSTDAVFYGYFCPYCESMLLEEVA